MRNIDWHKSIIKAAMAVALVMAAAVPLCASLKKAVHLPRPGDRFSVDEVEAYIPEPGATEWDMSSLSGLGRSQEVTVWGASDTAFAVIAGGVQTVYRIIGDTLHMLSAENRLDRKEFDIAVLRFPFDTGDTLTSSSAYNGVYCRTVRYEGLESVITCAIGSGTLIIHGDTLRGVTLIRHSILETDAEGGGEVKTRKDIHCWYSPQYRYPVAVTADERSKSGEAASAVTWLFPPDRQRYSIDRSCDVPRDEAETAEAPGTIRDAVVTNHGNYAEVAFTLTRDTPLEFVMSDSHGRVYAVHHGSGYPADERQTVRLDITALPPGNYVVHIRSAESAEAVKFVKGGL